MKRFILEVVSILCLSCAAVSAGAATISEPPVFLPVSPLIISAYSVQGDTPRYIELYNDGKTPLKAKDWAVTVHWQNVTGAPATTTSLTAQLFVPQGADKRELYIPPGGYVVVSFGVVDGALVQVGELELPDDAFVSGLEVGGVGHRPYVRAITEAQAKNDDTKRLNVGATGYTTTYGDVDKDKIYQMERFYEVPEGDFPLAPIEILANPKNCSPVATDLSCKEYVKFYNHTSQTVSFENTRLRAGSSVAALGGEVKSGHYATFMISLPNGGGFVSLEDTYGIHTYENTVVEYANTSAASKKGTSWALFDGGWDWATPNPGGANAPLPPAAPKATKTSSLKPCRADQFRNPETNRCKLIASVSSSLKPCAANQYRNPETNRCRLVTSASSTLKPCAANQYRNPETNRCRLISSASSSLKPCLPGQERNPATNRCRKVVSSAVPGADFGVTDAPDAAKSAVGWLAFAGVGAVAVGYGAWEWRRELGELGAKLGGMLKK